MNRHEVVLNIRYDAPREMWEMIWAIYRDMPGWIGTGENGPEWFGHDEDGIEDIKFIWASIEPGGLQIAANMDDDEWDAWINKFTALASAALGYAVGNIWDGYDPYPVYNP